MHDLRILKVENGYIIEEEVAVDRKTWVASSWYDITDVLKKYFTSPTDES